ncbi:MAG: chemotaxis protein CheA [Gorillibacterium sp.]|nr:chemotaxis protein CheA [Gorillibacterium sp.]
MEERSEYRDVYLEELEEQLRSMEEEVLCLEQEGQSDSGIQRLFRAAHTIKGSSAAMEYVKMKEVTHHMEHLLEKLRNNEMSVSAELVSLLFRCVDQLKLLQAEIVSGDMERSEVTFLIEELTRFGLLSLHPEPARINEVTPVLTEELLQVLYDEEATGSKSYWVKVGLSLHCEMPGPRTLLIDKKLRELGVILWAEFTGDSYPTIEVGKQTWIRWLLSGFTDVKHVRDVMVALTDVEEVVLEEFSGAIYQTELTGQPHEQAQAQAEHQMDKLSLQPERAKAQSIRVNVERLENLMNLVGELVIDQTRVQQVKTLFQRKFGSDELVGQLGQLSDHLTRIIGELHEGIMQVRMLPIEQLFSRFPRMVRDLAQTVDKQVELVLEGRETELDRTLIEELGDPLIHILRNAVDHGIESAAVRRKAGKKERGTIRIGASHEDNQVVIRIEDDGAGMDGAMLLKAAISKGLLTHEEADRLNDKEAVQLIFRSGFSTAETISEISGRGVGMDIVRDSIERMNGTIDIETKLGIGTRFRIALPLTLAIITGLKISVGGRIFVIPMNNVAEIIRIEPTQIRTMRGMPVTTVREKIIPVLWLHDYFHYRRASETGKHLPVVILEHGGKRLALVVDELLGNQDIVLKSLGSFIGKAQAASGATILGDGKVALILEVRELFTRI